MYIQLFFTTNCKVHFNITYVLVSPNKKNSFLIIEKCKVKMLVFKKEKMFSGGDLESLEKY